MTKKPEQKFKASFIKILKERGASVSTIEPALGSTTGIPDLAVSWGVRDFWLEVKVSKYLPTAQYTWDTLLRADQRIWIKNRLKSLREGVGKTMPIYVLVAFDDGVWLYHTPILREEDFLAPVLSYVKINTAITYLSEVCEVLAF